MNVHAQCQSKQKFSKAFEGSSKSKKLSKDNIHRKIYECLYFNLLLTAFMHNSSHSIGLKIPTPLSLKSLPRNIYFPG